TLEGYSGSVRLVAFSHDLTRLASALDDETVKIWDASSGECLQTLEGYSDAVNLVAFSYDLTRLASALDDKTVKIWDTSSSECLQTLNVGKVPSNILFNTTGLYLHTNISTISVNLNGQVYNIYFLLYI
ncbi:WD40 repeat-like protein, partial [Mytilinidion resinicola]